MIISFSIIGAPTQRISTRNSTSNARWGTGLTQRISTRNSTDNARWGTNTENFNKKFYRQCALGYGAQHREFQQEILQTMRVGVRGPTQRISTRNSTSNARWGTGPNIGKINSQ